MEGVVMAVSSVNPHKTNPTPRRTETEGGSNVTRARTEPRTTVEDSVRRRFDSARSSFEPARRPLVSLNAPSGAGAAPATNAQTFRVGPGGALTAPRGAGPDTAARSGSGPAMSADEAFICQFTHEKYNPTGPSGSSNCGPASLAIAMAYTGKMPPGLSKEQQVDYARAIMSPGRSGEFSYVNDANGNSVPQLNRDHEYTNGNMETNGVSAAGGSPSYGSGWGALDQALENGPVIANGYTDANWRAQFPERMGSGDVGHIATVLGKTENGNYIVADPLHTGGPVEMTKEQLSVFFSRTGGEPSFVSTNFGNNSGGSAPPATPGTTPPGTTPPATGGASGVPQTDVAYDGGTHYNPEVEKLQRSLVQAGYMTQAEMDTGPGFYGDKTKAAVAELQAEHGITGNDGLNFGPRSRAALTEKLSGMAGAPEAPGTPGTPADPGTQGPGPVGPTVDVNGVQLSAKDAETAKRIDQLLANRQPPGKLVGYGAVIVDACRKERVPVDLVMAQLAKESNFLNPDNNISIANNNPGNLRFAPWEANFGGTPGQANFTHFPSIEQGIRAYVNLLGQPIYRNDVDNRDWPSLVSKYAPSSDGNNEAEYAAQLTEWTAHFANAIGVDQNWVNNP